jgi:uncharacterized protein YjaG (DUF416 family)
VAFSEEHRWGDADALRKALDWGWRTLDGLPIEKRDLDEMRRAVDAAIPDADDFSTILVSSAMDAAIATKLLLQFVDGRKFESVLEVASLCRDTVDMYVSAGNNEVLENGTTEDLIVAHPLMQEELRRQREDARALASLTEFDTAKDVLKQRWRDQAQSNIGLRSRMARSTR